MGDDSYLSKSLTEEGRKRVAEHKNAEPQDKPDKATVDPQHSKPTKDINRSLSATPATTTSPTEPQTSKVLTYKATVYLQND